MIFARYDPATGDLLAIGATDDEFVEAEIAEGKPTITLDKHMDFASARYEYKVDLATKTLIKVDPPIVPVTPEPIRPISDRQFYQKAALKGLITQADALNAVQTGFIPLPLQTIVDQISDPTEKFSAEMLLSGATIFYREHPLTNEIGAAFGMTPEQIDVFFRSAGAL